MKTGQIKPLNCNINKAAEFDANKNLIGDRDISSATGGNADDLLDRTGVQAEISAIGVSSHASTHTDGTDDIQSATTGQKGLATATQITDLETVRDSSRIYVPRMTYASGTSAPAGNGEITGNSTTLSAITELRIYETDSDGNSILQLISANLSHGSLIRITSTDGTKWMTFKANFEYTDVGTFRTIPCELIDTNTTYAAMAGVDVYLTMDCITVNTTDLGIVCGTASASSVTLTAERLRLFDPAGRMLVTDEYIGGITAAITVSGVNGLDAGSESNSQWYWLWAISEGDGTTPGLLLSTSRTSPTMPSGYTYKRLVSAVFNDSTGDFREYAQSGNRFAYLETVQHQSGSLTINAWTAAPSIANFLPGASEEMLYDVDFHVQDTSYAGLSFASSSGWGGQYFTADTTTSATDFGGIFTSHNQQMTFRILASMAGASYHYYVADAGAVINILGFSVKLGLN